MDENKMMAGRKCFVTILFCVVSHYIMPSTSAETGATIETSMAPEGTESSLKQYRQFIHVSDFHIDPEYSNHNSCKSVPEGDKPYGDYLCDSPKILVKSAIKFMQKKFPTPDFILWTG